MKACNILNLVLTILVIVFGYLYYNERSKVPPPYTPPIINVPDKDSTSTGNVSVTPDTVLDIRYVVKRDTVLGAIDSAAVMKAHLAVLDSTQALEVMRLLQGRVFESRTSIKEPYLEGTIRNLAMLPVLQTTLDYTIFHKRWYDNVMKPVVDLNLKTAHDTGYRLGYTKGRKRGIIYGVVGAVATAIVINLSIPRN